MNIIRVPIVILGALICYGGGLAAGLLIGANHGRFSELGPIAVFAVFIGVATAVYGATRE